MLKQIIIIFSSLVFGMFSGEVVDNSVVNDNVVDAISIEQDLNTRQSTLMLEYTGKKWSPELEEELKDLDFEQFNFDVENPKMITDVNNLFVLANKANYFPEDFVPIDLVEPNSSFSGYPGNDRMRKVAADALDAMISAAAEEGQRIDNVSAYRSIEMQARIYKSYVEVDGEEAANRYSSKPGHSEHHTGLTTDVSSPSMNFALEQYYIDKPEGKWLADNCHKYGFIIRYPDGKEDITGYTYEPWHIRYLGVPLATYLYETGLTYEEFLALQVGKTPDEIRIED